MTENYTPPATWQRWADEGGEGAKMATEYEHGFADGMAAQAQALKRLEAQLATVTAERDAFKAQYDAVPVTAIKFCVNNTEPDYDLMAYWEDNRPVFEKAKSDIVDWLKGQV